MIAIPRNTKTLQGGSASAVQNNPAKMLGGKKLLTSVCLMLVTLVPSCSGTDQEFQDGEPIEGNYKGEGKWYPATFYMKNEKTNLYCVTYDDTPEREFPFELVWEEQDNVRRPVDKTAADSPEEDKPTEVENYIHGELEGEKNLRVLERYAMYGTCRNRELHKKFVTRIGDRRAVKGMMKKAARRELAIRYNSYGELRALVKN